jgi:hypothetical protein
MDPADGARYAIPWTLIVAMLAGSGLILLGTNWRGRVVVIVLIAGSLIYTMPFLLERSSEDSPPARAAAWIRENVPENAVILYELPLWPHATFWLSDHRIQKIDEGAPGLVRRAGVPVFIYGNGGSYDPDARVFSWKPSHVFSKVTRNHYGVVSVVEVPPDERYEIISGVYGSERDPLHEWRWVAERAELRLPDVDADELTLRMSLSRTVPHESTVVDVILNGKPAASVTVRRSEQSSVSIPLADGEQQLVFRCRNPFVPADQSDGRGDARRLCFQLLGVDQN